MIHTTNSINIMESLGSLFFVKLASEGDWCLCIWLLFVKEMVDYIKSNYDIYQRHNEKGYIIYSKLCTLRVII